MPSNINIRISLITQYILRLIIIFLACTNISYGQLKKDSIDIVNPSIAVIARVQKEGRILLRWGVTNQKAWHKSNKHGFELKRYTITKNGNILSVPEELHLGIFKPKPLEEWMEVIEANDNAAIYAQALYGESFDVSGMDELSAIINLSQEQEQRFTWALFAADQDFETAQMAGLGFIDHKIRNNEKYVYKLTSLVPNKELKIEEGGIFIGLEDYEDLPVPLDIAAVFLDQQVMLSWNYQIHKETYNYYIVERSEDGENFIRLNQKPLSTLNNSDKQTVSQMFYMDSVSNNRSYDYRVRGISPFGEIGPPSKIVSGEAKSVLAYVPRITNKDFIDESRIVLRWDFLEEGNKFITGFELNKSNHVDGPYKTVIDEIDASLRQIQYDSLSPTNYFTITALGKEGSNRTSLPVLVQPVDSIPPTAPIGLQGTIDSTGVVMLQWTRNVEVDLFGYRVFKANNPQEEFTQVTISPHKGIVFYDSVSVQSLNNHIYYRLIAVDQRFNQSEFSETLVLKKPDFIPPNPPIFNAYEIKEGTVHISWINSSSADVLTHELYRKESSENAWILLATVTNEANSQFQDYNISEGSKYYYTLIAKDESDLESEPANPLFVTIPKTSLLPAIEKFTGQVNKKEKIIELQWKPYVHEKVAELMIYKSKDDQKTTLFRNLLPDAIRLVDQDVKPNNLYTYIIRAMYLDGRISESSILELKY